MSKKSPITQKEIAQQTGISQTAVSLILSRTDNGKVSEETRQRVLQVANDLGYVPQAAAKTLLQGRSNNIGLVLVQPHYQVFTDPYVPNVLTGLTEVCRDQGFRIVVEHINDMNNVATIRTMLKGGEVDGIVINGFSLDVAALADEGLPIVLLNQYDDPIINSLYMSAIDHIIGVRILLTHVIAMGYRRIACITYGPLEATGIPSTGGVQQRLTTYRETLADANLDYDERLVRYGRYEPASAYHAMQSLLQEDTLPDVVYGMNDSMALGAIKAIQDAGLRVPEDIAVVGYDDMRFAEFINPSLTTMRAPEIEQGKVAAHMLIDLITETAPDEKHTLLLPELVIRHSCSFG